MFALTIEERDRRWKIVREAMKRRELECLIVCGVTGRYRQLTANARYLCNVAVEGFVVSKAYLLPSVLEFKHIPFRYSKLRETVKTFICIV